MIPNEVLYKRDLTGGLVRWWGRVEKVTNSDSTVSLRLAYYYGKVNGAETSSYSPVKLRVKKLIENKLNLNLIVFMKDIRNKDIKVFLI